MQHFHSKTTVNKFEGVQKKYITHILLTAYCIISITEQIYKLLPSNCKKNLPKTLYHPDASTDHSHKPWPEESVALRSLKMTDGVMLPFRS